MIRFSRSIEQRKQIYSCEANSLGVCGVAIKNEQIVYVLQMFVNNLCVNRRLLANHLHGKAADICLANS